MENKTNWQKFLNFCFEYKNFLIVWSGIIVVTILWVSAAEYRNDLNHTLWHWCIVLPWAIFAAFCFSIVDKTENNSETDDDNKTH